MFRTPADMDWTTMVQPGTSQIHAVQTPAMHMASPMVVSSLCAYFDPLGLA